MEIGVSPLVVSFPTERVLARPGLDTSKRFIVRTLTKRGTLYATRFERADWLYNAFVDRASADARVLELQGYNPGRQFAVVAIEWI